MGAADRTRVGDQAHPLGRRTTRQNDGGRTPKGSAERHLRVRSRPASTLGVGQYAARSKPAISVVDRVWTVVDELPNGDYMERVRSILLDLGLEDWIPIPEALANPEVAEATKGKDPPAVVADALTELVVEGKVRLYQGRWNEDPVAVLAPDALQLLKEPRWFSFRADEPNEERLYFVNVQNIRDS